MNIRTFHFKDSETTECTDVHVLENVDPNYGMYVWPSAPVLAQYIWFHRLKVRNKKVLELGSGTSLPGVLCAKVGADVTLTDSAFRPNCLDNCLKTCQQNDVDNVKVLGLTWGDISPELLTMRPDIIIASDCFYDTKDFENILVTISFLLSKNPKAECWITYQIRSTNRTIEHLLQKWNLVCKEEYLKDFCGKSSDHVPRHHTIKMFILQKREK